MKHPDDTQEALDFMTDRAQFLINNGMEREQALEESLDFWRQSLWRMQMMNRFHNDLRAQNKPTLHVSLFEAAKIR